MSFKIVPSIVAVAAVLVMWGGGSFDAKAAPPDKGSSKGNSGDKGNSGNGGAPEDKGKGSSDGDSTSSKGQSQAHKSIEWLTPKSEVEESLKESGEAVVEFVSHADLENITVWLTPSLKGMVADPEVFEELVDGETYSITLTLEEEPEHTLGGTIHLRPGDGEAKTFAPPYPVIVHVKGSDEDEEEDESEQPEVEPSAVVSGTTMRKGSVTPGGVVSIFGEGMGPSQMQTLRIDGRGRVSSYLADTEVLFNGIAAPLLATSKKQINAVVPQGIRSDTYADVVVTYRGKVSATLTLPVQPTSPGLFTVDGSGAGQAAALNQDRTLNSPEKPAPRGSVITLFGSGFGEWLQEVADGTISGQALPVPKSTVTATVGGLNAPIRYAGAAPGLVTGVVQLNLEIPAGVTPGEAVSVVVSAGGASSLPEVTIAVK